MKNIKYKLLGWILGLVALGANAAPVAIDTMFVQTASATLTVDVIGPTPPTSISASHVFLEPVPYVTMGDYQSSIFSISSSDSSMFLNIYSSSAYPAPSGVVDAETNTISVNFESLRAAGYYTIDSQMYNFDVGLWPINTTLDSGTYVPPDFNLGWSETFNIIVANGSFDVSLSGYLTTVPVPAAVWLFGSGLIALFGFAKSRKQ